MIRRILLITEIAILSALVLATRCANFQDVFVGGNIYYTDADCYARMMRVRMCAEHPGLVVRHHDFENFPQGTTPHTTAPLDYLIVSLSILLKPFTAQPIDLAGAVVSPLLALLGGWFLWWWSWRRKLRYRWVMLLIYAISPVLVHGAKLGRPDHQSLLILLLTIGVCAEWSLRKESSLTWSVAWGRNESPKTPPICSARAFPITRSVVFSAARPGRRRRFWFLPARTKPQNCSVSRINCKKLGFSTLNPLTM